MLLIYDTNLSVTSVNNLVRHPQANSCDANKQHRGDTNKQIHRDATIKLVITPPTNFIVAKQPTSS